MQLQAGKYYLNRKGEKVGPLVERKMTDGTIWFDTEPKSGYGFIPDGKVFAFEIDARDLISEYKDDELFETKKVLKNGEFGQMVVSGEGPSKLVIIRHSMFVNKPADRENLRQLANQLLEIADYWDGE